MKYLKKEMEKLADSNLSSDLTLLASGPASLVWCLCLQNVGERSITEQEEEPLAS